MVCDRCIMTVRDELEGLDYNVNSISLGEAKIEQSLDPSEVEEIANNLSDKGFELITKKNDELVEDIKVRLLAYLKTIEEQEDSPKVSSYLEEHLKYNYAYLSDYFSRQTDSTIEKHLINLKIERVKELLSYKELTLSEIAWKLNYSSVQYLSNQFKKVTGETVSSFRKHMDKKSRQSLDSIA